MIANVLLRCDITPEKLADNHDEEAFATQAGYRWDHSTKCLPEAGACVPFDNAPVAQQDRATLS